MFPSLLDRLCPLCHNTGGQLFEDAAHNNRLFFWPCPFECPPTGAHPIIRLRQSLVAAQKAAKKMHKWETNNAPFLLHRP